MGVQATPARLSQESVAARDMIERYHERYGSLPQSLAADTTYGNGELLQWLEERGIAPYIRVKENPNGPTDLYGIDQFTYVPEENCYLCPEGKVLKYVGINARNRTHIYYSTVKRCRDCSQKSRCTRGKYRTLAIHTCEAARQRAHALAQTSGFAISQRARRKVEALFAELKNYIGLGRLRLRGMRFVREQFYLAAAVQNLKRLVRFLSSKTTPNRRTHSAESRKSRRTTMRESGRKTAWQTRVFQQTQALAQACAFHSPFCWAMSFITSLGCLCGGGFLLGLGDLFGVTDKGGESWVAL